MRESWAAKGHGRTRAPPHSTTRLAGSPTFLRRGPAGLELEQVVAELFVAVTRPRQASSLQGRDQAVGDLDHIFPVEPHHGAGDEEAIPTNLVHELTHARRHLVRGADQLHPVAHTAVGDRLPQRLALGPAADALEAAPFAVG